MKLEASAIQTEIHVTPYENQFLVYAPLKKLAFVSNESMVNKIKALLMGKDLLAGEEKSEWYQYLSGLGLLQSDPPLNFSNESYQPTVAVLCMTTTCNFACSYCYASSGDVPKKIIGFTEGCAGIDRVIANARQLNEPYYTVAFHGGGEPTLYFPLFQRFMEYATSKSHPCRFELTSNGYWDAKKRDFLIKHIDQFTISFDGVPEVQNLQRPLISGRDTFREVMTTIHALDQHHKSYGIRLTATDFSSSYLPASIDFLCQNTDCSTFQVEPAFEVGRAAQRDIALAQYDEFADAFLQAHDIAAGYGKHLYYSGARPWVITDKFCGASDKALIITPDGDLTNCYEVSSNDHPLVEKFKIGEVNANGELFIDAAAQSRFANTITERQLGCESCICYRHCAGDCPVKVIGPGDDDHLERDARCDLNRQITKELLIRNIANAGGSLWCGDETMTRYISKAS